MRHADVAGFAGMRKHMVTTLDAPQCPTIRFQLLDESLAIHGGYYNPLKAELGVKRVAQPLPC
jgi:hypothetical protein